MPRKRMKIAGPTASTRARGIDASDLSPASSMLSSNVGSPGDSLASAPAMSPLLVCKGKQSSMKTVQEEGHDSDHGAPGLRHRVGNGKTSVSDAQPARSFSGNDDGDFEDTSRARPPRRRLVVAASEQDNQGGASANSSKGTVTSRKAAGTTQRKSSTAGSGSSAKNAQDAAKPDKKSAEARSASRADAQTQDEKGQDDAPPMQFEVHLNLCCSVLRVHTGGCALDSTVLTMLIHTDHYAR